MIGKVFIFDFNGNFFVIVEMVIDNIICIFMVFYIFGGVKCWDYVYQNFMLDNQVLFDILVKDQDVILIFSKIIVFGDVLMMIKIYENNFFFVFDFLV